MYGRIYVITFERVAVTAVQDLFEVLIAADMVAILHEIHVTQDSDAGDAASEQLYASIRRVSGAPTSGSGGSAATPRPRGQGDAAASVTAEVNNTTQLSGGTNVVLHGEAFNVMAGWHYVPTPEARLNFRGQTRLLVELEKAPADELTLSGSLVLEEIG